MDLVIDVGNTRIKGAFFQDQQLVYRFGLPTKPFPRNLLLNELRSHPIERCLLASVNLETERELSPLLDEEKIPFIPITVSRLKAMFEVDDPEEIGADRLGNIYGALTRFPLSDCLVIDIGTAVTFDLISSSGRYLGGAIIPSHEISAKALAHFTSLLDEVKIQKPPSALGVSTQKQIQSGLYYGLLGSIERISDEIRLTQESPSSVKVILTGGGTESFDPTDLLELVDLIEPELTLVGLREILNELSHKKE